MIPLDAFWRFVCFRPGLAAACREWEGCLGPDAWHALKDTLFSGNGLAAHCALSDGRVGKVVALSGGRHALVCCATGAVIEAEAEARGLRSYRLDLNRLGAEVARALDILKDPRPAPHPARLAPVGNWTPVQGHDVAVNMMLPPSSAALCRELQSLARPSNAGAMVLLPHAVALDAGLRADLKQQKVSIVPLCDVLELDESVGLVAAPAWVMYRNAYCKQFLPELMIPAGPDFAFEWAGDYWHLTFEGQTTHIRDGVGPRYIALLLVNGRKELFCADMVSLASGNPIIKVSQSKDLLADEQTIAACEKHLRELETELSEAMEFNDWGRQEKLQEKVDFAREHLLRLRGLDGQVRAFSGTFDSARTSVTNAINRALNSDAVKKRLPNAYRHLDKALSRGMFMSYDPETPVDWVISVRESDPLHAL